MKPPLSRAKPTATPRGKAKTAKARAAAATKKTTVMSETERRFAFHFMASARGNGSEAARLAGVPAKSAAREACRMMKLPKVVEFIERERRRRESKLQISADDVLIDLVFVREEARNLAATDPKGGLKLLLSACEKLGDHVSVGAFRRQVGIGNPDGSPLEFNLTVLSDDEASTLLGLLRRAAPALFDNVEAGTSAT